MSTSPAFSVRDLTVAYNEKPVLLDVDLDIPTGSLVGIIGPNGAGKSTLIKSIIGLKKPVFGSVEFKTLKDDTYKNIAYVPQTECIDWDFPTTVLDVVIMGRYGHLGIFKPVGKKERELALKTLAMVGMEDFSKRQIKNLSGGQRQRVFLARALVADPQIYFLDEPFKGVDKKTEKEIVEILKELGHHKKTIVAVHHDLQTVTEYFDYLVMVNRRIIASGLVCDVLNDENIKATYNTEMVFDQKVRC